MSSSDSHTQEHLRCPMLWCRRKLRDHQSVLLHISTCQWFDEDAWYWCPRCSRPESLMANAESAAIEAPYVSQRKHSKIKKAIQFIKCFDISWKKARSPSTGRSAIGGVGCGPHGVCQKGEMDANDCSIFEIDSALRSDRHELPASVSYGTIGQPAGFDASNPNYGWGDYQHSGNVHPNATSHSPFELPGNIPMFGTHNEDHMDHLQDMGAVPENMSSISQDVSPTSATMSPLSSSETFPILSLSTNHTSDFSGSPSSPSGTSNSCPMTSQTESSWHREAFGYDAQTTHITSSSSSSSSCSSFESGSTTAIESIQETRYLVSKFHTEWIERMEWSPSLQQSCSSLSVSAIFDKGTLVLQSCFNGILPQTFIEVFSLMHVAFAQVYMLYQDDATYPWDKFMQNMLEWEDVLLEDNEVLPYRVSMSALLRLPLDELLLLSAHRKSGNTCRDILFRTLRDGHIMEGSARFLESKSSALSQRF